MLKQNIALVFIALLVSLVLGELVVRLTIEQETKRLAIYDRDVGWRGRPNGEGVYLRTKEGIKAPFRFNSLGYRDDEPGPKDETVKRVLLTGDSFVEGLEVPLGETFHKVIEAQSGRNFDPAIEIVAMGSQGYSTAQEIRVFRKFRDLVQPDMVLIAFYTGNDFSDNMRGKFAYLDSNDQVVFPENEDSWLRSNYLAFQRWIYETSHLVFFVKNLIESNTNIRVAAASKKLAPAKRDRKLVVSSKLIAAAHTEVENYGAKFGVLFFPSYQEVAAGELGIVNQLISWCEDQGIAYLNLFPALSLENFFPYDGHFNSSGHQVVATAVHQFILSQYQEASEEAAN